MISFPEPTPHGGQAALRRVVRLAARALQVSSAQFVPCDGAGAPVAYGAAAALPHLGLSDVLRGERGMFVADTAEVPPLSRLGPAVRFFAAVPVTGPEGQRLGVLCLLDDGPRTLEPAEQQTLAEFGCLVGAVVESEGRAAQATPPHLSEGHGALTLLVDPRTGGIVGVSAAAAS